MSQPRLFVLVNEAVRARCAEYIARVAPDGWVIKAGPPSRTLDQNAKFHAICEDMEKAGAAWAGKPRDAKQWKVLLVSGHAIATGEGAEIVPGLENEFVNIRESTAAMSKRRGSSLIEYALAYCARNGIALRNEPEAETA